MNRLKGMKPVRFPTNFEAFTNAVACQLVSLTAGMHVVNRIAEKYGRDLSRSMARDFMRAPRLPISRMPRSRIFARSA